MSPLTPTQFVQTADAVELVISHNPNLRPTQHIQWYTFFALFLSSNILIILSVCYFSSSQRSINQYLVKTLLIIIIIHLIETLQGNVLYSL